jgi:hypothetical protein
VNLSCEQDATLNGVGRFRPTADRQGDEFRTDQQSFSLLNFYGVILKSLPLAIVFFYIFSIGAHAEEFDRFLLEGVWAESTNYQFGCRPDNIHQRLQLSADGKTLIFKNDRKWKIGTADDVTQYSAGVVRSAKNMLIIKYGPDLLGIPDEFREWEMRFIGPGTYLWRATPWPENQFNEVIGVKCKQ